jgi:hypothetical protein
MQISLDQDEITQYVEAGMRQEFGFGDDKEITIDFTMGRTPNGLTAALQITGMKVKAPAPVAKPVAAAPVAVAVAAPAVVQEEAEPEAVEEAAPEVAKEEAAAPAKKNIFGAGAVANEDVSPEAEAEAAPAPKRTSVFSNVKTG